MIPATGRRDRYLAPRVRQIDLQGESGVALVVALIVMTMRSLLTISSLEMLTLNVQITNNHIYDLQAMCIADAGLEDAIDRLRDDPNWDMGLTDVEFPAGSGNTYTVSIDNSGYPFMVITSTGTVSNFQRSLEIQIRVTGSSPPYSIRTIYWKNI